MNGLYRNVLFLATLLVMATAVYAQAAPPPNPAASTAQAITLLTPVVVPILVWGAKKLLADIPSVLLPILATVLGVGVTQLGVYMAGGHYGIVEGALLGLGGVGLREVLDQVKKVIGPPQ